MIINNSYLMTIIQISQWNYQINQKLNIQHKSINQMVLIKIQFSRIIILILHNQITLLINILGDQFYMDGYKYHKYLIFGGNNSSAIEAALLKRGNWQSVLKERVLDANFIWKPLNFSSKLYNDVDDIMKYGPNENFLLNHFEHNNVITTKAGLIRSLKYYYSHQPTMINQNNCLSDSVPTTFILNAHVDNTEYRAFKERFQELEKKNFNKEKVPSKHCQKNVWFLKPDGQNQGKGIMLSNDWKEIEAHLISKPVNTTWIAQKAIQKPLLYQQRKFDIRVWVLVTPQFQIYYYKIPYMRTSNQIYNLQALDGQIHLTNNFQQKKYKDYSKFQHGNTIPLTDLQKFLKNDPNVDADKTMNDIVSRMKSLIMDSLNSAKKYFTKAIRKKQFQLFGYDFLIDQDYRTWLIEVNNNPYLGCPNNFIKNLIPLMIDQMLQIIVDPYFRPVNYTTVATKNFELLHRQASSFRITPGRINSSETRKKISLAKQIMSPMRTPRKLNPVHCSTNQIEKEKQRPKYMTPQQSIKYLLETYCYTDYEPFFIPVNLVLSSPRLQQQSQLQSNIKTLRMICNTRVSSILLQKKFMDLCSDIIRSNKYHQKIKAVLIEGFDKAIKMFSNRIAVIKNIVPAISQLLMKICTSLQQQLISSIINLLIKLGGYLQRKIFIPGQSRQNQFARNYFIKTNTMSMLIYLKQKYPQVNKKQIEDFIENVDQKDWETYEQVTQITQNNNEQIMAQSDPILSKRLSINPNVITDEKPRVHSRRQVTQARSLRSRRQTAFPIIKK